jgi:hypothetical protein
VIKLNLRVGVGHLEVRHGSFFEGAPETVVPTSLVSDVPALQNFGDGTVLFADGSIDFGDGRRIEANGSYSITIVEQNPDGSVKLDNGAEIRADGTVVTPGGFVIPRHATPPVTTTSVLAPTPPGGGPTTVLEIQP